MSDSKLANATIDEDFFMLQSHLGGYRLLEDSLENELLHPDANAKIAGDSLSETQYFSVNIPEENIHGIIYCWHRPNLKIVTGGVWIWQGIKRPSLSSEIFDFRSFMSDRFLDNDLYHYRMENGLEVRLLEPYGNRFRATYSDNARQNGFELEYTAMTPVIMFETGVHFEQGVKLQGELTLRGKTYKVDTHNVRDRTWGSLRGEMPQPAPPVPWMTGAFSENFYFSVIAYDHPDLNPDWKDLYDFPSDKVLKSGWIYRDGNFFTVQSCRKITEHDPESLFPTAVRMELIDNEGNTYRLKGTIIAASNWTAWLNCEVVLSLCRWEYEGMIGHGDFQEARWTDYMHGRLNK